LYLLHTKCRPSPDSASENTTGVSLLNHPAAAATLCFGQQTGQITQMADVAIAIGFAGHMQIEPIPVTPGMVATFARFWRVSQGKDTVRPFA
jgi:hypothetical protein